MKKLPSFRETRQGIKRTEVGLFIAIEVKLTIVLVLNTASSDGVINLPGAPCPELPTFLPPGEGLTIL